MKKQVFVFAFFFFYFISFASESPRYFVELKLQGSELAIHIADAEPVANACDYFIRRMEYSSALQALSVELGLEPCFNDRYGRRSGDLKWILPISLRAGGKLALILGDKKVGDIIINGNHLKAELQ